MYTVIYGKAGKDASHEATTTCTQQHCQQCPGNKMSTHWNVNYIHKEVNIHLHMHLRTHCTIISARFYEHQWCPRVCHRGCITDRVRGIVFMRWATENYTRCL